MVYRLVRPGELDLYSVLMGESAPSTLTNNERIVMAYDKAFGEEVVSPTIGFVKMAGCV